MKKLFVLFMLTLACQFLFSQNDPRIARVATPLSEVPEMVMPPLDNKALLQAEMERRAPGIAPKFAENMEVNINPATHGVWEQLPNGNKVWRLRLRSDGAKSLNLGFTKYFMPVGGTLVLYSPNQAHIMGPFSPSDNEEHEQLWTPVLPGDEMVVEVQVPGHSISELQLQLKYVNHDFLGFAEIASGSCNLDAICGGADGWAIVDAYRDIIQSVAVIGMGGNTFCTGFLVNNGRQDCKPYFMTAFHCGINANGAAGLVAYWNFDNSTCRQPGSAASGGPGNGTMNDFNTGAVLRAGWSTSDFTLVEFDDPISPTANAFFAGWSAENVPATDTVICVHHPSGDEKRISFEFEPTYIGTWNTDDLPVPDGDHVIVADWDIGTTEGGSSGSPLFNNQHRVVGQLHGGDASCSNNAYDSFGWFKSSWEGGGTPSTRLKDWLDPDNSGTLVLDGRSQMQCSFFVNATPASISLCAPAVATYDISVSSNFNSDVTLSLSGVPAGATAAFAMNPVPPGGSTTLVLSGTIAFSPGTYTMTIAGTDGVESNTSEIALTVFAQAPTATVLTAPANGTTGAALTPIFTWQALAGVDYEIEVATDAAFTNILGTASGLSVGTFQLAAPLSSQNTYYWRVRGSNPCGTGAWSPAFSFATGAIFCAPIASQNVPVAISESGTPTVTSTLEVTGGGFIDDLNITNLVINHTWVGDLSIEIISPSGTTVTLMINPDCQEADLVLGFDDEATLPYSDLNSSCNIPPPAISGIFQPFQSLSAFDGEWSAGIWTLVITDDADQDGGELVSWGLDLCSTLPNDFSIIATDAVEGCVNQEVVFQVLTGTAFEISPGVTFSADNLPAGATATFSPNPAPPGTSVDVTLSGASTPGSFTFDLVATDGTNTNSAPVTWSVSAGPDSPTPIAPAQNATGIGLSPVLSWSQSADASSYFLQVATDPAMTNIVFTGTSTNPSNLVTGLTPCTTYYWTVTASNDCGEGVPTTVSSFTTQLDISIDLGQTGIVSCGNETFSNTLTLGPCFDANPGVTLSAVGLPANANLEFLTNPAQPGGSVGYSITIGNVVAGSYSITITATDGTHTTTKSFTLLITGTPATPVLIAPVDEAMGVSLTPALDWNAVAGATSYTVELATDPFFVNIVAEATNTTTIFNVTTPLLPGNWYFWRVTATNDCGSTTAGPFSFKALGTSSTHDLGQVQATILPNPTGGWVFVNFDRPVSELFDLQLYSVDGKFLEQQKLTVGNTSAALDLSTYPAGVYLLKLTSGTDTVTERIIRE